MVGKVNKNLSGLRKHKKSLNIFFLPFFNQDETDVTEFIVFYLEY